MLAAGDGPKRSQAPVVSTSFSHSEEVNATRSTLPAAYTSDLSGRLAIGGLFNRVFGVELAAIHFGTTDRAGGQTKAYAANLSLVARLPLASSFSLFGKVGATYGRTVVTATPGSLVPTGRSFGWGPSFGAGLSYDFNPIQSVVLEWEHHDLRFPGTGRQGVKNTTVGYVHRF